MPRKPDLAAARQLATDLARMAAQTHCPDVVVLEMGGISPITDFFVIATGTSSRQMRSVCDEGREVGAARGRRPLYSCGYEGDRWMLLDFIDVVLHVFDAASRAY